MSTPAITVDAPRARARYEQDVDRYAAVKQYSLAEILAVWAAAVIPMAILAWIVAPAVADRLSGAPKARWWEPSSSRSSCESTKR